MPKITGDHSASQWQSLATNGGQPVIITVSKNADGTPVRDPHK